MKVAHVVARLENPAAGTSYSVLSMAVALRRAGVGTQVHTLHPVPSDLAARVDIVTYPATQVTERLGVSLSMRRGLSLAEANILHNHGVWMMPNVYAGIVARRRQIPLMFAPRGMFSAWAMAFSRRRKAFVWWCLDQRRAVHATTCFHATSEGEAQDIRRLGFSQPIAVVPNGIDIPEVTPEPARACRCERRRVLFLSRIHPKKGLPILLQAWQNVEPSHPQWELVIVGPDEGGHLSEIEQIARRSMRVSFAGPAYGKVKDDIYRTADVFVLPTHSENFGLVVAEALSYGIPVITTTGAPWQELETRRCGWWVALSAENLARALRDAIRLSASERRQMGDRGRRWMEESFGWPRIALEMKHVYEWVLGGGAPPSCLMTD